MALLKSIAFHLLCVAFLSYPIWWDSFAAITALQWQVFLGVYFSLLAFSWVKYHHIFKLIDVAAIGTFFTALLLLSLVHFGNLPHANIVFLVGAIAAAFVTSAAFVDEGMDFKRWGGYEWLMVAILSLVNYLYTASAYGLVKDVIQSA